MSVDFRVPDYLDKIRSLFIIQKFYFFDLDKTLPDTQSDLARQAFKDPYIFDFLNLTEQRHEREFLALNNKRHNRKSLLCLICKYFSLSDLYLNQLVI